jgi:hypothetical protein
VDLCPIVGEFIKIQFKLPGGKPMACHALVTRLESRKNHRILVGVQFQKLQNSHKLLLVQALSEKLRNQMSSEDAFDVYGREQRKYRFKLYLIAALFFTLWSLSLLFFIFY